MKVAIVHDWITNPGGAEKVIQCMLEVYPDADVYTSVYNKKKMGDYFRGAKIHTSFIDKLPFAATKYSIYLGLMPLAFEQFDLRGYDVVISSSTSCAKGVLTDSDTVHICYCNTPMRYAWDFYFDYLNDGNNSVRKLLVHLLMHKIRQWDVLSACRVDYFIANSNNVARRIRKHYRRTSDVIYPPVETACGISDDMLQSGLTGDYYLIVSRLVPYKRIDLAVEAFNRLGMKLVIIGEGPELKHLKSMAGATISFAGRLNDNEKAEMFRGCRGLVFPGEEDFGITPVEAQAYGKPVIAYGRGGALETVIDGVTGVFFYRQDADSLAEAVRTAESLPFDRNRITENARRFDRELFKAKLKEYVEEKYRLFHEMKNDYKEGLY